MIYIGIDPGKQGSVSIIAGNNLMVVPTPILNKDYDIASMHEILFSRKDNSFAVLERSSAWPGQGVCSMFSFGRGYGIWETLLTISSISYQIIHPRTWTGAMLAGAPGKGKERSFYVARRLFPQWNPALKKEHQYCDSILLSAYAQRLYLGKKDKQEFE